MFQPQTREVETQAEDEQAFLARQQQLLQAGIPAGARQEPQMRTPTTVPKVGDRRSVGTPGVQAQLGSPKKVTPVPDILAPLHCHIPPFLYLVMDSPKVSSWRLMVAIL